MSALAPVLFVLLLPLSLFKVVDQLWFKPMPPHLQAGVGLTIQASPAPSSPPSPTPNSTPLSFTSPAPLPSISPVSLKAPSLVTDLSNWKLTLSTGSQGSPTEIRQPQLADFSAEPWFIKNGDGSLRFRAAVDGVTTGGSKYPRSELREMSNGGAKNAAWSSTAGSHTMVLDQVITAVPEVKKHVVAGQIHDSNDDVIVIRLEYPKLYINVDGQNQYLLDPNYTLGKRFNVKFDVQRGETKVYYNGASNPAYTLNKDYSGAYFKTGAYTQSNCTKETACNSSNYGEVVVYSAAVSHKD